MSNQKNAILTERGLDRVLGKYFGEITPTAGAHNAIFRGANITKYLTDGTLYKRLRGEDGFSLFEDLYVGDYYEAEVGTYGKHTFRIAGFDLYYGKGAWEDSINDEIYRHHAVIVPDEILFRARMNATNSTVDGYMYSEMCETTLPALAEQLEVIHSDHLLAWMHSFTDSMDADADSQWGTGIKGATDELVTDGAHKCFLMSVKEITGLSIGSSVWDNSYQNVQYPLFRLAPQYIIAIDKTVTYDDKRYWYWTSCVAAASSFAYVGGDGGVGNYNASGSSGGVRPAFLIG